MERFALMRGSGSNAATPQLSTRRLPATILHRARGLSCHSPRSSLSPERGEGRGEGLLRRRSRHGFTGGPDKAAGEHEHVLNRLTIDFDSDERALRVGGEALPRDGHLSDANA